jgi:hypothetical protein
MKNILIFVLALIPISLWAADEAKTVDNKDSNTYVHKDLFSISLPKGFWEIVAQGKNSKIEDYYLYTSSNKSKNDPYLIRVKVYETKADSDEKRKEAISDYIKDAKEMLGPEASKEWSIIDTKKPDKLSDRIRCSVTFKNPKIGLNYHEATLFFKKKTFLIEVFGPSQKEAEQRLIDAEKNFKVLIDQ